MKKMMFLGLCLGTTVSVFSVRNTQSNNIGLGNAKIVIVNNLSVNESDSRLPTTALARAFMKLTVPEKIMDHIQIDILEGSTENILSNVEIQDEIESKLKIL